MKETIKEVECPYCYGKGKVPLQMNDDVISIPLGWFREYEDLQNRLSRHMHILKKLRRKDEDPEPKKIAKESEHVNCLK